MPREKATRVRRSFTPEFKRDAMRLVEKGKTVTEAARDLGIARSLLQYWMRQERGGQEPSRSTGEGPSDSERVRQLEKELRDAREERDILRKALAYFADDQK
jgi:transposase